MQLHSCFSGFKNLMTNIEMENSEFKVFFRFRNNRSDIEKFKV